ncbi:MAG: 4-(cytidine 5'-diphospho)-2-C-methyl-D-erythritol kinase [Elusimicrobiota bacterium]|jgi:4-diphosphocytidyl-2-C-methyl-D-erythritol kinase|nr:4-(cytidine 5'-diphospho)-2-C-methyl-D-erythritol kinase [Elusimicrobiota bacterium]
MNKKYSLFIKAPAKINLFLEVTDKRQDGYHNIISVMQTVSLFDEIKIESGAGDGKIEIECSDKTIPTDESNIVYKAAQSMLDYFEIKNNLKFYIDKKIPTGAGLGGGSSDGAAVIKGLLRLWETAEKGCFANKECHLPQQTALAAKIGADIPFFLTGGTALCQGIGDIVRPIKVIGKKYVILVNPNVHISTAQAYKDLDFSLKKTGQKHRIPPSFDGSSLYEREDFYFNRFEEVIFPLYPQIAKIKADLKSLGCISLMTGSGSAVFGIAKSKEHSEEVFEEISKLGFKTHKVETC